MIFSARASCDDGTVILTEAGCARIRSAQTGSVSAETQQSVQRRLYTHTHPHTCTHARILEACEPEGLSRLSPSKFTHGSLELEQIRAE